MIRAIAIALVVACSTPEPYTCEFSDQCVRAGVTGICQPNGSCSFLDMACDSGQRFDETAPELDGECVPTEPLVGCISQIALGLDHSCVRHTTGRVDCWGNSQAGEVGNAQDNIGMVPLQSTVVGIGTGATHLSAGENFTCAIVGDSPFCWGNDTAQFKLGDGMPAADQSSPVAVLGAMPAIRIATGGRHACLTTEGSTQCWGDNSDGQLGIDVLDTPKDLPTTISQQFDEIVAGRDHTCARRGTTAFCWGDNLHGQTGASRASNMDAFAAVELTVLSDVAQIVGGGQHACARTHAGAVFCWGRNDAGQLGIGSESSAFAPNPLDLDNIVDLAAGGEFTCAIDAFGAVFCWGDNQQEQLGLGLDVSIEELSPVAVTTIDDATAIAAGGTHACVRRRGDGSLWCWGSNGSSRAAIANDEPVIPAPAPAGFVCP